MEQVMHLVVIGAGLIGCATAYELVRNGHTVELIESATDVGTGCSFANGAQLSYSFVEPLANPGTLKALPYLLLKADSPLRFKIQIDCLQWSWLFDFVRACTAKQASVGTYELLMLAGLSRATLETWMQDEKDWPIGFERSGKLVLCPDMKSLDQQARQVKFQEQWGSNQRLLTREECIGQEPALARSESNFVGGVWTASECVADPYLLCQALAASAVSRGVKLHLNTSVEGWVSKLGRVIGVTTTNNQIQADAFVVCAGTASVGIAHKLGLKLPIYPVKGYSLTLPVKEAMHSPQCSITDLGLKTVFAPLNGQLRVAAAAEIVGHGLELNQRRVAQMCSSVEKMFPGAFEIGASQPWAGLRPATPNSLPLIGPSPIPGVWLNTGHGALGLTLAAGSARRLVDTLASSRKVGRD
jgi:D-amino-acid dehydrogenase